MKILALDPGVHNYAYSLVSDAPALICCGHLSNTIQALTPKDFRTNALLFKDALNIVLEQAQLAATDCIVAERYQTRGHNTIQIELINIMTGIIADQFPNQLLLITPVTWKTHIKRKYNTPDVQTYITTPNLTPHIKDTLGLSVYVFEKFYAKSTFLDQLLATLHTQD